ncbi:microfibril-associated glycoprotein 4-like [Anopheles moucheti]|uniref:microfibril-associated glycoprotein 4-like n=1 Tax=Anopheles moucheti TaxID=186751 RepID=UPI0022F06935|nr:microfibril-associated glycoprotein 4-like [Anopheles moucheti]
MLSRVFAAALCLNAVFTFAAVSASNDTNSSTPKPPTDTGPSLGYGFEMIMAKLDYLQYKLLEMDFVMKEHSEGIEQNQGHLEKVFASMLWAISRLDQAVGNNLTALQAQSWKILSRQTVCANHELMRSEIFSLAPKQGLSAGARSLFDLQGMRHKGPFEACKDEPTKLSGKYLIRPTTDAEPFPVFCEQTKFGGGWLVIQHRFKGSLDFYRNWTEYRDGFGSIDQEFWIGLERLHQLTSAKPYQLLIEVEDFAGDYRYARYKEFEIGSEAEQYSLKKLGAYSGTGGDSLTYHKGFKFTTMDRDNDPSTSNCAVTCEGAWWFNNCHHSNLNGRFMNAVDMKSISWYHFKSSHQGMAYTRMMIREI